MTEGREGRETREDEKSTPKIERERPHAEQREPPWLADPQLPQVHSRGKESEGGEWEVRGRSWEGVMLEEESARTGGGEAPEEEGEVSVEDEGSKTSGVTTGGGTQAGSGAKSGEISGLSRAVRR